MRKRNILFPLFFFITLLIHSQNKSIDLEIEDYRKLILESKTDTAKINLYRKIAEVYSENNNTSAAIDNEKESLLIAKSSSLLSEIAISYINLAKYNRGVSNFKEGISLIDSALQYVSKVKNFSGWEELYFHQAALYYNLSAFDSSEASANKLLEISEDKKYHEIAYNILGGIYLSKARYKEALENFMLVRDIAKEIKEDRSLCLSLLNIALVNYHINSFDVAISNIDEAIPIAQKNNIIYLLAYAEHLKAIIARETKDYNRALEHLSKAEVFAKEAKSLSRLSLIKNDYGDIYLLQKNYTNAISQYEEAIKIANEIGSKYILHGSYVDLAGVYYEQDDIKASLAHLDSANFYTTSNNDKKGYYELSSKIYAKKNDYEKAYLHYKDFVYLKDSIDSITRKKETYVLEANYQFKLKEDEIEILNTKNQLQKSQLYALIGFVGLALLILLYIYSRFKAKAKINEQLKALDKTKTQFFTNISHEFRTPLSLMLGPIQTVLKNTTVQSDKDNLSLAYKNGKRLNTMINQLLDLSKIESNSMPLEVEKTDVSGFLRVVFSYFRSMADEKEITYNLDIDSRVGDGYLDKDKTEKILINLLSNAFKFTSNRGTIELKATVLKNNRLKVEVKDTGVGIPKDKISKIFNRFYQVDDSHTRTAEGSGIGLALSKELAEKHKGNLSVFSSKEKGSEFTLEIPTGIDSYAKEEIKPTSKSKIKSELFDLEFTGAELLEETGGSKSENPLLLIVEDNVDMQNFIASMLKDQYNIIIASNGKEAYSVALEKIPNIIISDYMMPIMDGMSFSKMIRDQEATSHIPIVMLTAKNEQSTRMESLETGVSSFLTKPFNTDELLLVINNLIDQQEKMKKLYREDSLLSIKDISLPASEKSFLERMMSLFEEKYDDVNFGIEQLSDRLCLSRVQVYRKVKAVTGESPGDLLRVFRLEKAKMLLQKSSSNVGEVSEKVGFGNQSNFSSKFKKHTGFSPSDYMNKHS